jgi:hypothetical protein
MFIILAAWEPEIREIVVSGQSRKKCLQDPISTEQKLGVVVYTCHSIDARKFKIGGSWTRLVCTKS